MAAGKPYLSVCSIYRDHAAYLREWIEFHRLVGVDRFFLYDNESTDEQKEVLSPYIELGIVEVHEWPSPPSARQKRHWGLRGAFDDCLARHRDDSRWIAFLDVDEFMFSPTGCTLPEVLQGFEQFSGVEVSRLDFGPSGHHTKPSGLVIESYLRRRPYVSPEQDLEQVKSVVDPTRAERTLNAHGFYYKDGYAVHEDGQRAHGDVPGSRTFPQTSLLRINHYITKSVEEYMAKRVQWAAAGLARRPPTGPFVELLSAEQDEAITVYVPALREALAKPVG
jgi:Glycosyltransferase family 92